MDGIELMHDYWQESPPSYPRKVATDAGLPIFSYIFGADLALPPGEQQQAFDSTFALLDRTADLGSPLAFLLPGFVKEGFSLADQRSWMIGRRPPRRSARPYCREKSGLDDLPPTCREPPSVPNGVSGT